MHVLLCTDRQAQDRSFRQSRPHNPSLKHRNRQGNHWHTRHGKDEGQHSADPVQPLTCEPGLEPLAQHITTHRHKQSPETAHTRRPTGSCGSGLTPPGPWLTARRAPEPRARPWRAQQGLQEMGFAGRRESGTGLLLLCTHPGPRPFPQPSVLISPPALSLSWRIDSSGPSWEGMAQISDGQGPPQSMLVPSHMPGSSSSLPANPVGL